MKCIIAAVDFSEASDDVVTLATQLATGLSAELAVVHIAAPNPDFVGYEAGPQTVRDDRAHELRDEHKQLQQMVQELERQGLTARPVLAQGPTVEKLVDEVHRMDAQLIVVGSHGHGALHRALLGSVSEGLIRHAPCPVVVIPAHE